MNHINDKITENMLIGDVLRLNDKLAPILLEMGMHCLGCPSSQMESLTDACMVHGVAIDPILQRLNSCLSDKGETV